MMVSKQVNKKGKKREKKIAKALQVLKVQRITGSQECDMLYLNKYNYNYYIVAINCMLTEGNVYMYMLSSLCKCLSSWSHAIVEYTCTPKNVWVKYFVATSQFDNSNSKS